MASRRPLVAEGEVGLEARGARNFRARLAIILVAVGCALALPAGVARAEGTSDFKLFPVPFVSTDPNAGVTYGLILAFLETRDARTRSITAPSVSYSDIFGVTGTFRHFYYPQGDEKITTYASYGTGSEQAYYLEYKNPSVLNRTYSLEGQAGYRRLITQRFFGIGPGSTSDDETAYTREEVGGTAGVGVYLADDLRAVLQGRLRKVYVLSSPLDLPAPEDLFPETPGLDGDLVGGTKLSLIWDSRDSIDIPSGGLYGIAGLEIGSRNLVGDVSFQRFELEGRAFLSGASHRYVTAVRVLGQYVVGSDIPFFELSRLGGSSELRGFGEDRFADHGKILLQLEERIRFYDLTLFDVFTQLEVAPFLDVGKVFDTHDPFWAEMRPVGGVGIRLLVPPNVVAAVDIGYGSDGSAIFANLGYPF
ncbi:MAG: BamA/TamA family outer membrane protein [Deltaproteobacteria bacterium]|nr:BamA/TamA family outer membrane protein [Deltaproteobacteria bacterium]